MEVWPVKPGVNCSITEVSLMFVTARLVGGSGLTTK